LVKAASDPSNVRFVIPWNGSTGRGTKVLSHSAFAATDPSICTVSANTVTIRHTFDFEITVLVTLGILGLQGWPRKEYFVSRESF
jgi:hypothetical protein